jgi:trans-2,3-dihydro-3-hydroxyanthranilate isomerase
MQKIAREINFSETTFITSRQPRNGGYDVRIFTPNAEVEFAGHPTLGTAHIIRNKLRLTEATDVTLNLRVGRIPVTFTEAPDNTSLLWMRQMPPRFGKQLEKSALARVLNIAETDIDQRFPIEEVSTGFPTLVVPLRDMAALKRAKVDKDAYFALVRDAWAKLILVFSPEGYEPKQRLSVRMFADYFGIAEDAATGSSNGCLAAYLARHKVLGSPNVDILVGQGYEIGRPSSLALRTKGTNDNVEVSVGGSVVDVAEGIWG